MSELWIEAESFEEKGGWVTDSQSVPVIGSAYLMAHGMGTPVADATTHVTVEADGTYTLWALTRDWTATWDIKRSAGTFKILVDGTPLPAILGTNGKDWAWQEAGKVNLTAGTHTLVLSDLTGFNGRCDALYLTDGTNIPSSDKEDIEDMRRRLNYRAITEHDTAYTLVVVGGGIAGICTALSAIRSGVNALILNDRPLLGGCNSSEIRVAIGGKSRIGEYTQLGNVVRDITPIMGFADIYRAEFFEDHRKLAAFRASGGKSRVMLNESVTALEKEGNRITAVICTNMQTGQKTRIKGSYFADCSGDAVLARLGGATVMYGKEGRDEYGESLAPAQHKKSVMGHSIRWYSVQETSASDFPLLDWGLPFTDDNYLNCTSGDWEQETGFYRDMVTEAEYIRDFGLRAIYANWSFQKNVCRDKARFANRRLAWVSPFGGKREGYRVLGDYLLTQHDLEANTEYHDGTACVSWGIDIHYAEPRNAEAFGEPFRSFAYHRAMPKPCPVPYRCLYAKDIDNLFLGGRIISATHIAFSAARVMRTLGMLGEVVGMAASICAKHGCSPREVYTSHLEELKKLMREGVQIPDTFDFAAIGSEEKYHFRDMGFWHINSGKIACNAMPITQTEIDRFKHAVGTLGLEHMHPLPKEWQ